MTARCLGIALIATLPSCLIAQAAPTIEYEATALVARVEPGASVVWFGVARQFDNYALDLVSRYEILSDEDDDGIVRLTLDREVPRQSLWIVCDIESGEFVASTPEGYPLRWIDFPAGAIHPGPNLDVLSREHELLEVLLVRPGVGAWLRRVGDGGEFDHDGVLDGTASLATSELEPLGDTPNLRPPVFLPHDVLLAIDHRSLEAYGSTVLAAMQGS